MQPPAPLKIGPWQLPARAVLAPMAGVTDRPFRVLARRFGAGLAASEMLTSDTSLWHTAKSRRRLDHSGEPEPRVVQLAGAEPAAIAQAARLNVDMGAQIIDINMGCPAKKVCGRSCGSALLRDEPLVAAILDAVVRAVSVPVTLKIRTGWDRDSINGVRIARLAESHGIQSLAVHGRTRADRYEGQAEYDTIRSIKSMVRIPVFANGDIDSPQKAQSVLALTGADGVMIGRASHGAPWIFRDVNVLLDGGAPFDALAPRQLRDIILEHLVSLYEFYGETAGVRIARKHISWYCDRLSVPESIRRALLAAGNTVEQFGLAENHFAQGADADRADLSARWNAVGERKW
jgi:tRNA-dihydrouridine synthase B